MSCLFQSLQLWLLICKVPSLILTENKYNIGHFIGRTKVDRNMEKNSREFSEDKTLTLSSRFWTSFFCSTFVCKVRPLTEDIKVVKCYTQLSSLITFVSLNYYLKLCKDDVNVSEGLKASSIKRPFFKKPPTCAVFVTKCKLNADKIEGSALKFSR